MSKKEFAKNITAFVAALLFGLGLALSGMVDPNKIIGFLNVFSIGTSWRPELIFVMGGALIVYAIFYFFIKKRESPLLNPEFLLPIKKQVDQKLIIGSVLFGIGWGLGGFCPGPAIVSLVTLELNPILFVVSMLVGMLVFQKLTGTHEETK